MEQPRNLLVVTIDGLAARDLGAYGNTWIETPGLDRIASHAWLAETVLANRVESGAGLGDLLHLPQTDRSIADVARETGRTTYWFSDEPQADGSPRASDAFDLAETLNLPVPEGPAEALEGTHCAQFFARLLQLRETATVPHLIWAHYGGLSRYWDAPSEDRLRLELDEEVSPPTWTIPPLGGIDPDRDSDRRLQIVWAWAAQVTVLDRCIAALWESLQAENDCDLLLTSPRGFPLGEHGQVGGNPAIPYSEMTMVPLLACEAGSPLGWRELGLFSTRAVPQLLAAKLAGRAWTAELIPSEPLQLIRGSNHAAVRQTDWYLIRQGEQCELYVKPDDRWEVNDVCQRCHDVVAELSRQLPS